MKNLVVSLVCLFAFGACATTQPPTSSTNTVAAHARTVGTQGSTRARTFEVANNAHDSEDTDHEARGIPTPQPVRESGMSAHAIPVPQPPIPTPDHHNGSTPSYVSRWAN